MQRELNLRGLHFPSPLPHSQPSSSASGPIWLSGSSAERLSNIWRRLGTGSSLLRCLLPLFGRTGSAEWAWMCRDGGESGEKRVELGDLAKPCPSSLREGIDEAGREPPNPNAPPPSSPEAQAQPPCFWVMLGAGGSRVRGSHLRESGGCMEVRPHFLVVLREAFYPPAALPRSDALSQLLGPLLLAGWKPVLPWPWLTPSPNATLSESLGAPGAFIILIRNPALQSTFGSAGSVSSQNHVCANHMRVSWDISL